MGTPRLIHISVDFNTMTMHPEQRVWIPASSDPEILALLQPGMRVVLYEDDLQVDAVVHDEGLGDWWGAPDVTTCRQKRASTPQLPDPDVAVDPPSDSHNPLTTPR